MTQPAAAPPAPPTKSTVAAWALWDCGFVGMYAIVVTFVFSVYLTESVGEGMPAGASPASWLGRALAIAGVTVAVLAPLIGVWVQAPRHRRSALTVLTSASVLLTACMAFVRDDPSYLFFGLALLAATAACGDLANVPYNAMLKQLSTPENSGRISGFGSAAGYLGSVFLLLVVYVGLIMGDGPARGLLGLPADDGFNIRIVMVVTAAWFLIFALPLLFTAHRILPPDTVAEHAPTSMLGGYRQVWTDLKSEWRRDRNLVYYLLASAVFRDGLTGVFTFGAVLGVAVYGISPADVLIFGVAALIIAGVGAITGGYVDDRVGAKPVIIGSLVVMVFVGVALLMLSGPVAFVACGLTLCFFIGPAQASARALLLRMTAEGREGVTFGLYTMTGRAVTFLAPWLFSVFVDVFDAERAGLGGILVVLVAGLVAMMFVRTPGVTQRPNTASGPSRTAP